MDRPQWNAYISSMISFIFVTLMLCSVPVKASAQADTTWFTDARFGMFIHFGLYSIPGGVWKGQTMGRNAYAEWIRMQEGWPRPGGIPKTEYDTLLNQFNPRDFNADEWVREAKSAGMRYLIITAKHHDGFALWDSKVSDYNVVRATPFKRDILAEITVACRKYGLKVGFYYSHWQDWEYPGGGLPPWPEMVGDPIVQQPSQEEFERYWTHKCLPQVEELIQNYHPDLLWFDSWGKRQEELLTPERLQRLIALVRRLSPQTLINSRIGTVDGVDFISTDDNDFSSQGFKTPWETSGTMNRSWGFNRTDIAWKSTQSLLENLIGNVSRGGNYQLNIGPTGEGRILSPDIRRLREIGAWLYVNGDGIYGAGAAPYPVPSWGKLTQKTMPDGSLRLYAFVINPATGKELHLAGVSEQPKRAWVLETGEAVQCKSTSYGLDFRLPDAVPDSRITAVAFELPRPVRP